jgi:hypothetical protein
MKPPGLRSALRLTRLSGLPGSPAGDVFPLLRFKDPARQARLAVEGTPGGRPGRPGHREDNPDAVAPTAGLPGRGVRRHKDRMIAAGSPPAAPDADDMGRAVAKAQLPVRWYPPARTGDRDFPDELTLPLTYCLVLHDRPLPAGRRPAYAGSGRGRQIRVLQGGRRRRQAPAGAGRRQAPVARTAANAALDPAGLPTCRRRPTVADDGPGHGVGQYGRDDDTQAGRERRSHQDPAHGRAEVPSPRPGGLGPPAAAWRLVPRRRPLTVS